MSNETSDLASIGKLDKKLDNLLRKVETNLEEKVDVKVRCLIQQCTSARLQTKFESKERNEPAEFVEISKGAVFFVCFLKEATEADVDKLAKALVNVKLSEEDEEKSAGSVSVLELPGSILIVPQATLGGKMKGKRIQYHRNVSKETGLELYNLFIRLVDKHAKLSPKWLTASKKEEEEEKRVKIVHGTYGIKQVYSTQTNGPNLHIIEI